MEILCGDEFGLNTLFEYITVSGIKWMSVTSGNKTGPFSESTIDDRLHECWISLMIDTDLS